MIEPLAKLIDWSVLQAVSMLMPRLDVRNPRLEEALDFLRGPDFIPAESQPAKVEFKAGKSSLHFTFPTPRPSEFEENNIVPGRLYRCAGRWQERPVIILLHGGGDFANHLVGFPWIARKCNRAGLNAATLVAPYHFQRHPSQFGKFGVLQRPDFFLRFAKSMSQAVAEIRALTVWLLAEGCPAVALWGVSLGGWLAGLTVTHDARPRTVVLTVPGVCMKLILLQAEHSCSRRTREAILGQQSAYDAMDRTPINLTLSQPVISRENILLIEGKYDLMVSSALVEQLWEAWNQPEIWRLPLGHISCAGLPSLLGRILRWLRPRLESGKG